MPAFGDGGVGREARDAHARTTRTGTCRSSTRSTCCSTPTTQAPDAIVDGAALTALRTAAVSGLATRHLANARRPATRDLRRGGAGAIAPRGDARRPPDRACHGRVADACARARRWSTEVAWPGARRRRRRSDDAVAERRPRLHVHDERRAAVRRRPARRRGARERRRQLSARRRESSTPTRSLPARGRRRDARGGVRRGRRAC